VLDQMEFGLTVAIVGRAEVADVLSGA